MTQYVFTPPHPASLSVQGSDERFPVRRVYCVGRNYGDHAREMGHDPDREAPFFFQKNPDNLWQHSEMTYPPGTADLHHEVELAVALGAGGRDIDVSSAMSHVWGYGVALDMTRRDLQAAAKKAGRPWEIGKAAEQSAPIGPLIAKPDAGHIEHAEISLKVNGAVRQVGNISQMIWQIPEIIAYLSRYFELSAGDVILTGTPAGVGPVQKGDVLEGKITNLPDLNISVI